MAHQFSATELLTKRHGKPFNRKNLRLAPARTLRYVLYRDTFGLLESFQKQMAGLRRHVDVTRMHFDRIYGQQLLMWAHAQGDEKLRHTAVILLTMYERD